MDADTVYLCMKENVPISRASRVQWLLNKLNTIVTLPTDNTTWLDDGDFKILSILPSEHVQDQETNNRNEYMITTNTKLKFLADCYRIVYCLDMSPSQSSVDIQCGEILFNEIFTCFKRSIEGLVQPFMVPGSRIVIEPKIYLTVIAHTPFFMTPAQQVLIKGMQITLTNVEHIYDVVEKQLKILEERIAAVSKMVHCQIDEQKINNEKLFGCVLDESQIFTESLPNIPVVSPDVNFVNMLRYSMLALSLLPENCLSNIIIITDGVVALPDVVIMESLLTQLHYDGTAVSFIKLGSLFHPHVGAGYIPYSDILRFLSNSTLGMYLEALPLSDTNTQDKSFDINVHHKAYLIWSFHSNNMEENLRSEIDTKSSWNTTNKYLYSQKMPTLLRKKQIEDKVNASIYLLLPRRVRSGFTIDRIQYNNDLLQIELSLPWKSFIYLKYIMSSPWPSTHAVVQYSVYVAAPYEFLHDITCLAKKELKSNLRQAVVEKFWNVLTHLTSGDISLVQNMYPFQNSNVWYTLPESVKNRLSTFVIANNNTSLDAAKPQFSASDSKFGSIWQPICQLENSQWNKWFHTQKISLIVRHDEPLPTNLHLPNSSGRFEIIQCRQSTSALYARLTDWCSFILIENHSYVKFLNNDLEKPVWFCIIRMTSKCPCIVINLGFMTGTPGHVRQKVYVEIKQELSQLYLSSLRNQENNACTLLNKPLEKILIRYERMPNDFNTVVFPDGTQPPNQYHHWLPPPVVGALFTTLSRYLYHKRWIWYTSCTKTWKPCITAIAQILSTLTRIRLKEGFNFAHSASGIINMVLEVEMCATSAIKDSLSCVIQYVIFPPHCRNFVDMREQGSGSEDETEKEHELETELQIVTEVWIEPQYGFVAHSPKSRSYMESQQYYQLADKIGLVDSECISSLLTLEHLNMRCKTNTEKQNEENKCIPRRKISTIQNSKVPDLTLLNDNFKYANSFVQDKSSLLDERIHTIPFFFNLNNILPICQQTELLFSMFTEDKNGSAKTPNELEMSNKLFMNAFHIQLQLLHDHELCLSSEDFLNFFQMLCKRHNREDTAHKCTLTSYYYLHSDRTIPQWRCFIKSVSTTHVIMTFVPASLTDLKHLFNSSMEPNEKQENNSNTLILPVYIYNCSSTIIIDCYINTENKSWRNNSLPDVFEDYTYDSETSLDEDVYKQRKNKTVIIKQKYDDADVDDKSAVKQHCRTVVTTHSKCFVMSLFRSLRSRIHVDRTDVQSALGQCDIVVDEIDITEYLKVICGHLKFTKDTNIIIQNLTDATVCDDLKPLHKLIKEKFVKIIRNAFQPTPTSPEFYFSLPCVTTDRMIINDENGDDEILSVPSEISNLKSDEHSLISSEEIDVTNFVHVSTNLINEYSDGDDDIKPLFLHLNCSVHIDTDVHHMPLKDLPTCLEDILTNVFYSKDSINLLDLQVTLDIICLTLPPDVPTEGTQTVARSTRKISFCSLNPFPNTGFSKTETKPSKDIFVETVNIFNHLPKFQQKIIRALKEEIKWFLRDEMSTSLLDLEPVNGDTLNMIINHIESSPSKLSCKKDIINLDFVYGISNSGEKFLNEFRELPIYVEDNIRYKLCEEKDLYYLAKYPIKETDTINLSINDENDPIFAEEEDYAWLNNIDRKRSILPNFWLILRMDQDTVTIYFHCRFLDLQTSKVDKFLSVQKAVILSVQDLCKKVNQSMLLQYLHDTKTCDRLLEPEDDETEIWHSHNATPILTRNASFAKKIAENENFFDSSDIHPTAYLEASLKFTSGYFRCNSVWQTHFSLHPRLKTGPGKSGLSRGIQALRTVLNKFSVTNRNNMFVYQDISSNVFYLRLHENVQNNAKLHAFRSQDENGVTRSPSISSLMKGSYKCLSLDQETEIRPRVRSIGEQETPIGDAIILKVHGITDAGPDVKCELVQVLQNRLDDAVLEILSMMLARNALCPLTPEDVHFLQKPFRLPENIIRLSIPEHALSFLDAFFHYLRQNLLQFLNVPKYTDTNSYNHFKDYSEKGQKSLYKEDLIFLYNQSQHPSSGNRGLACIVLTLISNRNASNNTLPGDCNYSKLFQNHTFQKIVTSQILPENNNECTVYLEFRIWKQGRLNLDMLKVKLESAVCHSVWDLVSEYHILRAPLCYKNKKNLPEENQLLVSFIYSGFSLCVDDSVTAQNIKNNNYKVNKLYKLLPIASDTRRKLSKESSMNAPWNTIAEMKTKSTSSSVISLEMVNPNVVRISTDNTLKNTEYQLKTILNSYEQGDNGVLHEVYSTILVQWFEYAIKLNVPSVRKCEIPLVNRHSINACVRELKHIVNTLAPNTSVKAFDLKYSHHDNHGELYVPHRDENIMPVKCLLIGRNFEQWKMSTAYDPTIDYNSWIEVSLLKHYQKFIPHTATVNNRFVPRQRLFLAVIISNSITLYTYNWSKERVDKLIIQSSNFGMWIDARAYLLSSIISQKRGLFHNPTTFRKSTQSINNPFLCHVGESSDHLYKFPSSSVSTMNKDYTSRKSMKSIHGTVIDVFRDFPPTLYFVDCNHDAAVTYSFEMHDMKQRHKHCSDEKKRMNNVWQSRGTTTGTLLQTNMLKRHARIIHYCHTPLLFLQKWRLMSAATRDYTICTDILEESNVSPELSTNSTDNVTWHDELCLEFIREYKLYLQILGFVLLEVLENRNNNENSNASNIHYVQKPMLGGIMIFAIELKEPFFTVKLYTIECCRLQQKVSRNLFNQFTLSFLDECDRIKSLMHLHSFTYDFHLRCVHSYVANNPNIKICMNYHLTHFLDDFFKYYPKTPNFARNVFTSEIIAINDLVTEGQQLYAFLLANTKQYNMNVVRMKKSESLIASNNDYVLVQVSNTPQVTYKDSQDRQQTDDFNVTLIVTNLRTNWQHNEHALRFKFYLIVTSHREIYPKCDIEKTLGKFRTVTSTGINFITNQTVTNNFDEKHFAEKLEEGTNKEESSSILNSDENKNDETTCDVNEKQNYEQENWKTGNSHSHVEIKPESVNYLGYYSSHEQLMQQLMIDQLSVARQKIEKMITQGMVHCRTHLLWMKLVSNEESNFLTYEEFTELRELSKLENLVNFYPELKILLDHPFSWYQTLVKLLVNKYNEQNRIYVSPDGNIQHLVVLHPRFIDTFMMVSTDVHTQRGDLYVVSRELPQCDASEKSNQLRKELINSFINCVVAHIWSGMVQF